MNHLNCSINKAYVKVQSPSNIAFIKYWGKSPVQKPNNPSLSMTLSECRSETSISFEKADSFDISSFIFENQNDDLFKVKTKEKIEALINFMPWLNSYHLKIESKNTFPHSSGIASSASGFSAIIFALLTFEDKLLGTSIDMNRASELSRLCSGSASRSLFSGYSHWGVSHFENGNDRYALEISYPQDFENTIAIVSSKTKDVSSSAGHKLMEDHPFAAARYEMARVNLEKIDHALKNNNLAVFGEILEREALTLHALMMSSTPSYILLEQRSLAIINEVRKFRQASGEHLYFTIDAGPNIHLIYLKTSKITAFIESVISPLCDQLIFDRKGDGPCVMEERYE